MTPNVLESVVAPVTPSVLESVVAPATPNAPPTFNLLAIPTPPDTISAPVVVDVDSSGLETFNCPLIFTESENLTSLLNVTGPSN